MKKIISLALVLLMVVSAFAFTSCKKNNNDYVAADATDLLQEDFGIAIQKGNTAMKTAVDEVVNEWVANGKIDDYIDYYQNLADYEEGNIDTAPDAGDLKTSWTFGNGGVITVYTESGFAPFEFLSNNNVIGVDIAIMSEVAERLGKSIEIKDVVFDTIPTCVATASGDAVGAAGLTIDAERKQTVDFSAVYYKSTLVIVSAGGKYTSLEGLDGLTIGVQAGTSGDKIATDANKGYTYEDANGETVTINASIEVRPYDKYAYAFTDLKNGRIDAILMDKIPAIMMLNSIN